MSTGHPYPTTVTLTASFYFENAKGAIRCNRDRISADNDCYAPPWFEKCGFFLTEKPRRDSAEGRATRSHGAPAREKPQQQRGRSTRAETRKISACITPGFRKLARIAVAMLTITIVPICIDMERSAARVEECSGSSCLEVLTATSSRIMTAAAEKMPADKYSFRPIAGSLTFGALVLHISNSNRGAFHSLTCSTAARKDNLTADSPKAELAASLQSFLRLLQ